MLPEPLFSYNSAAKCFEGWMEWYFYVISMHKEVRGCFEN